jgi:hypothetical protein
MSVANPNGMCYLCKHFTQCCHYALKEGYTGAIDPYDEECVFNIGFDLCARAMKQAAMAIKFTRPEEIVAKKDTWKSIERNVAAALRGNRIPVTGRVRGWVPDIDHPVFAIEVKHKEVKRPDWITKAYEQAVAASEKTGKTPLVVDHRLYESTGESMIFMRLDDLLGLFGPLADENWWDESPERVLERRREILIAIETMRLAVDPVESGEGE